MRSLCGVACHSSGNNNGDFGSHAGSLSRTSEGGHLRGFSGVWVQPTGTEVPRLTTCLLAGINKQDTGWSGAVGDEICYNCDF